MCDQPALDLDGKRLFQNAPFAADNMKDHGEEGAKHRDFEKEISDEKPAAFEVGQTVPERVEEHRAEKTDDRSGDLQGRVVSLASDADADACHAGEQDVRIRRENAANEPRNEQTVNSVLIQAPAVIINVLHRRETQRHNTRINYAVNHTVEILAKEKRDDQHANPFGALFDNRRRDDAGQLVAERKSYDAVGDRREEDGDDRPPEEGENQRSWRFGIVTIKPQKGGQVKARRDDRPYRSLKGCGRPDVMDGQPRHHHTDHGEDQPHQRRGRRLLRFAGVEMRVVESNVERAVPQPQSRRLPNVILYSRTVMPQGGGVGGVYSHGVLSLDQNLQTGALTA